MLTSYIMTYPSTHGYQSARLSHEELRMQSLTEWFTPPTAIHFRQVDVEDAIDNLDLKNSRYNPGETAINAVEIFMKPSHPSLSHLSPEIIATIFFINDDELQVVTPLRSHEAQRRLKDLIEGYIAQLAERMGDPVEDSERSFLLVTERFVTPIDPWRRGDSTT